MSVLQRCPLRESRLYQTLFSSEVSAGYSNKIAVTGTKQGGETCAEERLGNKQQERRRLRVRAALSLSRVFHLVQFVKCWRIFLELNSKADCNCTV